MVIKYATLGGQLVRANDLYNSEELTARGLKPEAKVLSTNKALVTEQSWSKNPETLLEVSSFR